MSVIVHIFACVLHFLPEDSTRGRIRERPDAVAEFVRWKRSNKHGSNRGFKIMVEKFQQWYHRWCVRTINKACYVLSSKYSVINHLYVQLKARYHGVYCFFKGKEKSFKQKIHNDPCREKSVTKLNTGGKKQIPTSTLTAIKTDP